MMTGLRFAHKLVLITALASGLVSLTVGAVFYYISETALENQLTDYRINTAEQLMDKVDRKLFAAHQGIQALAHDGYLVEFLQENGTDGATPGSDSNLESAISRHLEDASLLTGPWRVVTLLDTQGNFAVSNMPREGQGSLRNHPEYQAAYEAALEQRVYSSDLRLVGEQNEPSLIFSAPVQPQGLQEAPVIGVVMAEYAWPALNQVLDDVESGVELQLVRNDGTIIAAGSSNRQRIGTEASNWSVLESAGLNRGSRTLDGQDEHHTVATRQDGYLGYPGQEWLLVLKTPYQMLFAPIRALEWQLAGLAVAGVLVLCLVLYFAGTYLTRPIESMSRTVSSFSRGNMSGRVTIQTNDELADLGRAFNAMAEDIAYYVEQVRENSREVQSFAYIVSHDLRSPLVNLQGFSTEIGYSLDELRSLLEPVRDSLTETQRNQLDEILDRDLPEALEFIASSVKRMDGQIQSILNLSRLGRREMNWETVDTQELVSRLLRSLQHQLEAKSVEVSLGDLPKVEADAVALEQIFGNLLDNALKYMGEGPGRLEVWSTSGPQSILFHVRDNGPGIDPANITRVFELFRRVGRTDVAGEGMGLAYVKTLVRRHGGRIWCESELGKGSCFSFSLAETPSIQVRKLQ